MIIESISIDSFGKLNKLELCFHENLNIIQGKNESGKSTIAAYIKYMLYGFSGAEKKRFVSWETSCAAGSMTVRTDSGKRYKINRKTVLSNDTYRESGSITDLADGSVVFAKRTAGDAILKLPEEIFENVAFVGQFSDSKTSPDTTEAIENMLFSGDESVNAQKALDKLEHARRALLHKNGKGGAIYELTCQKEALTRSFNDSLKKNEEIFEGEAILSKTESELKSTEAQSEHLCACVETYNTMLALDEFEKLHKKENKLSLLCQKRDELIEKNTHDGFCPDRDYITALAIADAKIKEAKLSFEKAAERLHLRELETKETDEYRSIAKKAESRGGTEKTRQLAQSLDAKSKRVSAQSKKTLYVGIALCVVLLGVFLVIAALSKKKKAQRLEAELRELCTEFGARSADELFAVLANFDAQSRAYQQAKALAAEAKREYASDEIAYNTARAELTSLLAKWGKDADSDIKAMCAEINAFQREADSLSSDIYIARTACDEIREKLSEKDEEALRSSLDEKEPQLLEFVRTNDIAKINEALNFCRNKQKALATKERDVREKYISLKATSSSPSEIKEKIDSLEQRLDELKKQHAAYMLACEAIEGAGERLRSGMSPKLAEYAQDAVAFITDGKYRDIGVDSSLELSCTYENETRSPELFSAGTKMAIYLSLRMALIDLVCPEKVPLCLDETLAYQDDTRAKRLLEFLIDKTKSKVQCFLFTCHTREAEMTGDKEAAIISL